MRALSGVLGVLVTGLFAYTADVAVASAGFGRYQPSARFWLVDREPGNAAQLWYGGMLEPITVTERRVPTPILVTGNAAGPSCPPADSQARVIPVKAGA
ncbi:MAG TPA: hypothetical protein VLT79_05580 [Gemmatimonadales bacterium]|nr:hypothetical protein [Gemmatimonadales bacterium]